MIGKRFKQAVDPVVGSDLPSSSPVPQEAAGVLAGFPFPDVNFSALELRDRVVIMLLFDQIVSEEDVARAWKAWKHQNGEASKEPFWRLLTMHPELDRELIFAEAARVYGFEEARILRNSALGLMKQGLRLFGKDAWERMLDLRVVPIAETDQHHSHRAQMVFATQDPTHPEVHSLMSQLKLDGFVLRYAPEREILDLLAEAYPRKFEGVRDQYERDERGPVNMAFAEEESLDLYEEFRDHVAASAPKRQLSRASIIQLFEDILVEAVRQQASDVCILPDPNGKVEIFFQVDKHLKPWPVAENLDPGTLLSALKTEIIESDPNRQGESQNRVLQRWIGERLLRFRVIVLPPSQKFHAESVVIRVLN